MGTPQIPDSKVPDLDQCPRITDFPRVGAILWVVLAAFFIPPTALTVIANQMGGIPHQTLWVILLGVPIPLALLLLPRKYQLDPEKLAIVGLFYRVRIPRAEITGLEKVSVATALLHLGSMFCTDPARAYKIQRKGKRALIISPKDFTPFSTLQNPAGPGGGTGTGPTAL